MAGKNKGVGTTDANTTGGETEKKERKARTVKVKHAPDGPHAKLHEALDKMDASQVQYLHLHLKKAFAAELPTDGDDIAANYGATAHNGVKAALGV